MSNYCHRCGIFYALHCKCPQQHYVFSDGTLTKQYDGVCPACGESFCLEDFTRMKGQLIIRTEMAEKQLKIAMDALEFIRHPCWSSTDSRAAGNAIKKIKELGNDKR